VQCQADSEEEVGREGGEEGDQRLWEAGKCALGLGVDVGVQQSHVIPPLGAIEEGLVVNEVIVSAGSPNIRERIGGERLFNSANEIGECHLEILAIFILKVNLDTILASGVVEEYSDFINESRSAITEEPLFDLLSLDRSREELEVDGGSRKGSLEVVPPDGSVKGAKDLIVWDVVDELGHSFLFRIVNAEILGEVGQVLRVGAWIISGLGKLQKLMHELKGNELPLNVEG